jgi:hypothetical protein
MSDDEAKYYRDSWMSADQWECALMLAHLARGFHHLAGPIKRCGSGVSVSWRTGMATWDFSELTRLVVMAHDRCIRAEITQGGPGLLKVLLHKRHTREGDISRRHPTLEEHIALCRPKRVETEAP